MQPDPTCQLPIGYRDPSGRVHRKLALRKMTGAEEDLLYDAALNPGQLVSALLAACTVRLGDLPGVDSEVVRSMQLADRNYALLELRRLSLGDRLACRYDCPHCAAVLVATEDLADIDVARPAEEAWPLKLPVELQDGYRDGAGNVHRRVILRSPTGEDEEFVARFAVQHPLRANDALILRCIDGFGDLPQSALDGFGVELLRGLTLGDRRRIAAAFEQITFGPDFRRRLRCEACALEFEALLDTTSFFADG